MIPIQYIALIYIIFHLGSTAYMLSVIRKQSLVSRLALVGDPAKIRNVLNIITVLVLLGNLIPIVIDTLTLFVDSIPRPRFISFLSLVYGASNAITELLLAIAFWFMYRIAVSPSDYENLKRVHGRKK